MVDRDPFYVFIGQELLKIEHVFINLQSFHSLVFYFNFAPIRIDVHVSNENICTIQWFTLNVYLLDFRQDPQSFSKVCLSKRKFVYLRDVYDFASFFAGLSSILKTQQKEPPRTSSRLRSVLIVVAIPFCQ